MRRLLSSTAAAVLLLAAVGVTDGALAASKTPGATAQTVTTQLPRTVVPSHYDVAFTPDAANLTFTGSVRITVEVLEPTKTIVLQAHELTFAKASIKGSGKGAGAATIAVDEKAQTASFTFAKPVTKGRHVLSIDYAGKINTQATGLFALDYETDAGKKRALYTQFQAPDARRFVPSWDEPFYKATFSLTATVPTGQMAISNMPAQKTVDLGGGKSRVTFATSPKMSTYLLFFGLGEFERATIKAGGAEIGVVTKKGDLAQAQFALKSAGPILEWYNDYFGVNYPLPKLDHIAAPGQSQFFAAMENWGAIFYFEYALLMDPALSTQEDREGVYTTVAHETAHQWFGNLVTMAWWDDLWLNEGFATWLEGRTSEKFFPEWNSALNAIAGREYAMGLDALATTHPVVQPMKTVEEASEAFDGITYQKGQAVIGMLESYAGADAWRDGVRSYIKANTYGSTVTDDLWGAVEVAAGKPIKAIARDFTLQPGVPLITVSSAGCVNGASQLTLTQGEFTKDRPGKTPLRWSVPVASRAVSGGAQVQALVENGEARVAVPGCGPVVVNAGQAGYFRTLYTPELFKGLAANFASLQPIDQLGLLSDVYALGLAGLQPATDALDLSIATPISADPKIWSRVTAIHAAVYGYYDGMPAEQAQFRKVALARLSPLMTRVGWTAKAGESGPEATLRGDVIAVLGRLGDPAVVAEAKRRYAADKTDPAAVPGPLRKTILGIVAASADAAGWEAMRAQAKAETNALLRTELYTLLGAARDPVLARRALELAMTDEPGATTSPNIISRVASVHPDLAFDFAVANKAAVEAKVDASGRTGYLSSLGGRSSDPAMLAKLDALTASDPTLAREVEKAKAAVSYRLSVREGQLPAITAWVKKTGG